MDTPDRSRGPTGDEPVTPPRGTTPQPALLALMGGPMRFVYSAVPVVVFVAANAVLPLIATIIVSGAVGSAIAGYRLLRGERFGPVAGGLLVPALAIGIATTTGSARDLVVIGTWAYLAAFVVALGSVLARRPLSGVVWNLVHGGTFAWRDDRRVLHAHDAATLVAAVVSGARFGVQQWLDVGDGTGRLGAVRTATGWPLTVLVVLVVVRAWRRSSRRLLLST